MANCSEKIRLGKSDVFVPPMGIGIISWGSKHMGYGKSYSNDDIWQAYRTCLDAGLNFFDTAEMYAKGESERILSECQRKDGRPIIISTKFAPHSLVTPSKERKSPQSLMKALDGSLKRLRIECIDLYNFHVPPAENMLDEYMDVMAEAVRVGKVRAVGLCNFTATSMKWAHSRLTEHGIPLASIMVGYNLLRRYPETNGILDACRELDVTLIAFAPFAEGVLTGKYRSGGTKIPGIYRVLFYLEQLDLLKERGESVSILKRLFSKPRALNLKKLEPLFLTLEEIAKNRGKSIAQIALNWLMPEDGNIIPIPGAKNVRQVKENTGAVGWYLTKEERMCIEKAEIASR
ncbi:MAG: aldo/keto reductase [Spirochaetales bacterium]|nr:aldo/keto reductase [Spirochaetales bacterium]